MNLTAKISVLGILVIILTVATLLLVGIRTSNLELEQQIGERNTAYAQALMDDINVLAFEALQDIELMAEDKEIEEFVSNYEDIEQTREKLKEWQFLTGPWYSLEVYNLEEEVILGLEEHNEANHDEVELEAIEQVILTEKVYYSDAFFSEEHGKITQLFASPIRNENLSLEPVVGVIVGKLAWEVVEEVLQKSGEKMHLYNSQGLLIASSEYDQDDEYLVSSLEDLNLHLNHIAESIESLVSYSEQHEEKILLTHVVSDGYLSYEGKNWILVLEEPYDEAFDSTTQLSKNLLLVGLLVAVLSIIIFFLTIKKLTRPILLLKEKTDKISKGNLGETIKLKTGDEIEELADSFDNMRYSLKMVIDEYEEKLSEMKPNNENKKETRKTK